MAVPAEVLRYGAEVAARVHHALGGRLLGLCFVGSVAFGDHVPGRSDVDLLGVVDGSPTEALLHEAAARVSHPRLRCPARGLELVLHDHAVVGTPGPGPAFLLNLDTGPRMAQHVGLDPAAEPAFWFVLDRAIARAHGRAVTGPTPADLLAPVPRAAVLAALAEGLAWSRGGGVPPEHAVLNACRAWRYAADGVLGSKADGAAWARARWTAPATLDIAVGRRHGEEVALPPTAVAALLDHVADVVAGATGAPR